MSQRVYWVLELEIFEGKLDEFKSLVGEMNETTRSREEGTLGYEFHFSADNRYCHVFELFADSDSALAHCLAFGESFADRFVQLVKPVRLEVYGMPDERVREALTAFSPNYYNRVNGFFR